MAGKRAGSRRGPRVRRGLDAALLGLALGVTLLLVAWGYLVLAAIDFGSAARGGRGEAWWFLALASLGAAACLFAGLMLAVRILRRLGITAAPEAAAAGHGDRTPHPDLHEAPPGRSVPHDDASAGPEVLGVRPKPPPRAPGGRRIKT